MARWRMGVSGEPVQGTVHTPSSVPPGQGLSTGHARWQRLQHRAWQDSQDSLEPLAHLSGLPASGRASHLPGRQKPVFHPRLLLL